MTATDQFSDSNLGTLAVVVAPTPTAISVSASSATPAFGQPETLTATVTTPGGDTIPNSSDGMVTFFDGTTVLGSATLAGSPATATLTIPAGLAVGSHAITASYGGDVDFRPSSSGVESTSAQLVVPAIGLNDPTGVAVDGRATSSSPTPATTRSWRCRPTAPSPPSAPGSVARRAWRWTAPATSSSPTRTTTDRGGEGRRHPDHLGSGFAFPSGVAVDGSGDVFIADTGNNQSRRCCPTAPRPPSAPGSVTRRAWRWTASGDVFIADSGNNQVDGGAGRRHPDHSAPGFNTPIGVAVDSPGDVFIADNGNSRVVEVKPDGTQTTVGSGLNSPTGVAVDGNGDVFIADTLNNRVVEVTAGVPVTVVPATPTVSVTPFNITYGTALSNTQLIGTATWTVGGSRSPWRGPSPTTPPRGPSWVPAPARAKRSPSRPATAPTTPRRPQR